MARERIVDQQPAMGDGLNDVSDDLALLPTQLRLAINARLTEYGAVTKRGGTQRAHFLALGVVGGVVLENLSGFVVLESSTSLDDYLLQEAT
jgi:hypothetical protein